MKWTQWLELGNLHKACDFQACWAKRVILNQQGS